MSKKEQVTEEKVMTKYDRKLQRRAEEKKREQREKTTGTITAVVILVALVCFVLSFPIRTYFTLNNTYITVGGEKLNKVEYDYHFYTTMNDFINQYGSYLQYMGLDVNQDISKQAFSENMTWKDYFDEMTVDAVKRSKSLKQDGEKAGFSVNVEDTYKQFIQNQKAAAEKAGVSYSQYLKDAFGPYATEKRIAPYIRESAYVAEYYTHVESGKLPSDAEMEAYYAENKNTYDSVNYKVITIEAELPTEPTELADEDAEVKEDEQYKPSDAEIEKAMADAKVIADAQLNKLSSDGERIVGATYSTVSSAIREWLYDESRKSGHKTVIEDSTYHRYYVIGFEARYRDETATRDIRGILESKEKAEEFLAKWKENPTEAHFIEMCNGEYKEVSLSTDGGLVEGLSEKDLSDEINAFLFAKDTKPGMASVVPMSDASSYVMYYVGENVPSWKSDVKVTVTNNKMNEYVEELIKDCKVEDPKGYLKYIQIREEEEKKAAEAIEADSSEE